MMKKGRDEWRVMSDELRKDKPNPFHFDFISLSAEDTETEG